MFLNMPEHPDAAQEDAIIGRVLEGNSEAFREIVDLYAPRVLSFCRAHMRSEEDARDAAQEVFIRAYKSLGSYRRGENFASWLFAIAPTMCARMPSFFRQIDRRKNCFGKGTLRSRRAILRKRPS